MKDIVPEELEHVAVPVFRPAEVAVQLSPVHHRAQLGQQPEQPGRLDLLGELALERVAAAVRRVELQGVNNSIDFKNCPKRILEKAI